eukprot:gene9989-6972_t
MCLGLETQGLDTKANSLPVPLHSFGSAQLDGHIFLSLAALFYICIAAGTVPLCVVVQQQKEEKNSATYHPTVEVIFFRCSSFRPNILYSKAKEASVHRVPHRSPQLNF